MNKKVLTLENEALVLFWLENHRGKQMKGDSRKLMYDIYRLWKQDRDSSVCTCLDRDTHRKVEGFINTIDWSEETKSSPKMQQLLPNVYVEPTYTEEETSTQPVEVDMEKVAKAIQKRKRTTKK
jgi:hypothetical protein